MTGGVIGGAPATCFLLSLTVLVVPILYTRAQLERDKITLGLLTSKPLLFLLDQPFPALTLKGGYSLKVGPVSRSISQFVFSPSYFGEFA